MSRTKTKQNLSWRTLNRRAAEIEKKNKGRPNAYSKKLRTQAANLRKTERLSRKADNITEIARDALFALRDQATGEWQEVTPPVPQVEADQTPETFTKSQIINAHYEGHCEAVKKMNDDIVFSIIANYNDGAGRWPKNVPWIISGAEMRALMSVLDKAGYTQYGMRTAYNDTKTAENKDYSEVGKAS